jgi:tryptophan synthase beta chain
VAEAAQRAPSMPKDAILLVNLSGRGDKDLDTVMHTMSQEDPHGN